MNPKRLRYLPLPLVTLVLELLPLGAVCNFANPEGEPLRRTFSYFDLVPFGYANFSPLLTAILTCVITVLLVSYLFSGSRRLIRITAVLTLAAGALSLCPLLYGIRFYSVVGGLISLTLLLETALLFARTPDEEGKGGGE